MKKQTSKVEDSSQSVLEAVLEDSLHSHKAHDLNTPLLPPEIYDVLPHILKYFVKGYSGRERDVLLLSSLTSLSSVFPNSYFTNYRNKKYYLTLNVFVVAPAANNKSISQEGLKLIQPYHDELRKLAKLRIAEYKKLSKKDQKTREIPRQLTLIIPGDISIAGIKIILHDNNGIGILFETESDIFSDSKKQSWSDYDTLIRMAAEHEPIKSYRAVKNEYIEIKNPRLAIFATGTPERVKAFIRSEENGLFSRILFYLYENELKWENHYRNKLAKSDTSKIVKTAYNKIKDYKDKDCEIVFTQQQFDKMDDYFKKIVSNINSGQSFFNPSACKRYGTNLLRIAGLLTTLRSKVPTVKRLDCTDIDFDIALKIISSLVKHSEAFSNLLNHRGTAPRSKLDQFYQLLPAGKFKRASAIIVGEKMGMSHRSIDYYLEKLSDLEKIKKLTNEFGYYENT